MGLGYLLFGWGSENPPVSAEAEAIGRHYEEEAVINAAYHTVKNGGSTEDWQGWAWTGDAIEGANSVEATVDRQIMSDESRKDAA